jgi:iron(III) transport system substrate-binding protein
MKRQAITRRLFLQMTAALTAACSAPSAPPATVPASQGTAPTPATAPAPAVQATASVAQPAITGDSAAWQAILEAGRKEGRVLMYGNLMGGDEATRLAAEFKAATGIEFDFITMLGGPAITRIREEIKANKAPDIFEAAGGWVVGMAPEGVFVPLREKPLPIWSEPMSAWQIHPGYKVDDYQYVLSRLRPREGNTCVNTKLLSPADFPASWQDVATNPKFKGQIAYLDPTATTAAAGELVMSVYVGKSMPARDFWRILVEQDAVLYKQARAHHESVARGERAITFSAGDEAIVNLVNAGAPIKNLHFPNASYVAVTADMGVLQAAQHPNAALVFINWFLGKQGQEAIGKIQQVGSIRRDVPNYIPDALKGDVVGGGPKGPLLIQTSEQTQLTTDLQTSGILKLLVDGSSADAFEAAWNGFIKEWEAKNGGLQDTPKVLPT